VMVLDLTISKHAKMYFVQLLCIAICVIDTRWLTDAALAPAYGSREVVLWPKSAKSGNAHPAIANNTVELWCQANDTHIGAQPIRLDLEKTYWIHAAHPDTRINATNNENDKNATLILTHAKVTEAGTYTCHLVAIGGNEVAVGNVAVYMQPVFHQNDTTTAIDVDRQNHFNLTAGGRMVTAGDTVVIPCHAIGNPTPNYKWTKRDVNNEKSVHQPILLNDRIKLSDNKQILTISDAQPEDRAEYMCTAYNEFVAVRNGPRQQFNATMKTFVRVKGRNAWLIPLIGIIVVSILLVAVIAVCEFRRKRKERQHEQEKEQLEPEEED